MTTVIQAQDVSFSYGGEPILTKIGFSVCKGDFVAIIGQNGAGKSTLIKLLLGLLPLQSGSIRLFDREIRRFKDWPKIGYVPQNGISGAGFPATAEEIVRLNLYSQIGPLRFPKKVHAEKVKKALELVSMEKHAKSLIGSLSGGQLQRVMIARVLVSGPEVMLLDEPTTGIDTKAAQALYELLARLNRETGLTIAMVTHDIARASDYVSRTLCLEEGSLVELQREQVKEELSHKHKHPHIIWRDAEENMGNDL